MGVNPTQPWFVAREAHGLDQMLPGGPGGAGGGCRGGQTQALVGPDPPTEECGARAGPSTLRLRRSNLTSCILTRGHYDTFPMAVQEPTARKPALQGPGGLTSEVKPSQREHRAPGPSSPTRLPAGPQGGRLVWLQRQLLGLSSLLLSLQPLPQYLPPRHPLQDPRAPHSPRPRPHSGRQDRSARPRPPHRAGQQDPAALR